MLNQIYHLYQNPNSISIETLIINYFNSTTKAPYNNVMNHYIFDNNITYNITNDYFLGVCDLNIFLFFSIFDLNSFLFMAENFFIGNTFLISSNDLEILYPIFGFLMTLIHPLNITDNTYFYKMICPLKEIYNLLRISIPSILTVYTDEVPDNFIRNLCLTKGNLIYISIIKEANTYTVNKKLFYTKIDNIEPPEVEINNFPKIPKMAKIIRKFNNINETLGLVREQIRYYKSPKFVGIENKSIFTYADFSEIRKRMNGIMIGLFNKIIEKSFFTYDDNQITIEVIIKKMIDDTPIEFEPSKLFEILYKTGISVNNVNLKTMKEKMLLDEMIKTYELEPNRLFFDLTKKSEDITNVTENLQIDMLKRKYPLMFIMNKINRFFLKNLNIPNPMNDFGKTNILKYKELKLYFEIYKNIDTNIATLLLEKVNDILYVELEIFSNLTYINDIPIKNKKDNVACLIGLTLSLILLNKVRNKQTDQSFINDNFDKLYNLMKKTKCFYQKMNFLLSFIYEIMEWNVILHDKYKDKFMKKMIKYKVIPTISMLIKGKNFNNIPNDINNTFNFEYQSIDEVTFDNHEHYYELFDDLLEPYKCDECKKNIKLKINQTYEIILENPRVILLRLIFAILSEGTVYINDLNSFYNKWKHDLYQICFLSKLYLGLSLFNKKN